MPHFDLTHRWQCRKIYSSIKLILNVNLNLFVGSRNDTKIFLWNKVCILFEIPMVFNILLHQIYLMNWEQKIVLERWYYQQHEPDTLNGMVNSLLKLIDLYKEVWDAWLRLIIGIPIYLLWMHLALVSFKCCVRKDTNTNLYRVF